MLLSAEHLAIGKLTPAVQLFEQTSRHHGTLQVLERWHLMGSSAMQPTAQDLQCHGSPLCSSGTSVHSCQGSGRLFLPFTQVWRQIC